MCAKIPAPKPINLKKSSELRLPTLILLVFNIFNNETQVLHALEALDQVFCNAYKE
jgi:hypothetical protein